MTNLEQHAELVRAMTTTRRIKTAVKIIVSILAAFVAVQYVALAVYL